MEEAARTQQPFARTFHRHLWIPRFLPAVVALLALCVAGNTAIAAAAKAQHHHDAKQLVGGKLKQDGHHDIDHKGKYTTSVEVKGGKIAAVNVTHAEKGNIAVKKYKTHRKMAQNTDGHLMYASFQLAQMQDMGEEYIGYSYVDDNGNEEIYWFPVEVVYDGDTGATEYVPLSS
jgi:major membrane immunogen (membrane-anchored lipoprotein)